MKLKFAIATILLAATATANAQGFMIGYMMGSSSDKKQKDTPLVMFSQKNDVIICKKAYNDGERCDEIVNRQFLTPAQYAAKNGYKVLHRVGTAIYDGSTYIVMEVSR